MDNEFEEFFEEFDSDYGIQSLFEDSEVTSSAPGMKESVTEHLEAENVTMVRRMTVDGGGAEREENPEEGGGEAWTQYVIM